MNCPECKEEITYLVLSSIVEATSKVTLKDTMHIETISCSNVDDMYSCPECETILTDNYSQARRILGDTDE